MTTLLERAAAQLTSCFVPQAAHRAAAAAIAEAATLRAEKEQLEKTLTQVRRPQRAGCAAAVGALGDHGGKAWRGAPELL